LTTPSPPVHRPTVFLFDIDGTLVASSGAGKRAVHGAVERLYGRAPDDFPYDGLTDRAIVRACVESVGGDATEEAIDAVLETYLEILRETVATAEGYRTHPGVHAALDAAAALPDAALGLGTGNIERGARVKLARVGLHERFAFGGFGSDAEPRAELLAVGAQRGAERLGRPVSACRVVVIGDTPRDVAAAKAIGAQCLAVATGGATLEELRATDAEWVFPTLEAPGCLDALVRGERPG